MVPNKLHVGYHILHLVYCSICSIYNFFRIFVSTSISGVGLQFSLLVLCVWFWCQGVRAAQCEFGALLPLLFSGTHYSGTGLLFL